MRANETQNSHSALYELPDTFCFINLMKKNCRTRCAPTLSKTSKQRIHPQRRFLHIWRDCAQRIQYRRVATHNCGNGPILFIDQFQAHKLTSKLIFYARPQKILLYFTRLAQINDLH